MIRQLLTFFYPFRWYLLFSGGLIVLLSYADYSGWRLMGGGGQQQWRASGYSGHK